MNVFVKALTLAFVFCIVAGFPGVRLHDCNWPHPDVVDLPAIFPLFHLDPDDPENYQFAKTDAYIKPIIENGATILYRMGR